MDDDVEIILQTDSVDVTEPLVADYILPKATSSTLGGVKIGDNVNVASDGTISIPKATSSSLGVVQAGTGISIDANGVISASGEYTLPQATKTTLGGVYLDDELNNESVNPVQNSTLTTILDGMSTTLTDMSGAVDDMGDTVESLSDTVDDLSDSVTDLSTTVGTNTGNISTNTSNISTLTGTVGDINQGLTQLGNDVGTLSGQVDGLLQNISITYTYEDIDDTIWTAGDVEIRGKGFYAVMYIQLEGTLTITANSSVTLYTMPNNDIPAYDAYGSADIVDGSISIKVDSYNGNINLINNNTTSMNIGKLNASIPIIYGSI